jgi:hypothetical protein
MLTVAPCAAQSNAMGLHGSAHTKLLPSVVEHRPIGHQATFAHQAVAAPSSAYNGAPVSSDQANKGLSEVLPPVRTSVPHSLSRRV